MDSIKLAHLFPTFRNLGGVEAILKHHYAEDAKWGLDSEFAIYFEDGREPKERVHYLGLGPGSSIADTRRAVGSALRAIRPEVVLYHGTWGMHYMVSVDEAGRRLIILHSETPGLSGELAARSAWLDGVLCVSPPLVALAKRSLPHLSERRIGLVPYPIAPPENRPLRPRMAGPLVLGFCSRLVVEQKRVDRLPELCRQLDHKKVDYRLEFLGDGPERARLEGQFPDRAKFVFHGRKQGADYWDTLGGWDAILFVSDYEGTPIAMLEAMSMGVLPVFPRIGCGGDAYAEAVWPKLLYPAEDLAAACAAIVALADAPSERWKALRQSARGGVAHHLGASYITKVAAFVRSIREAERISQSNTPPRPFPIDRLSFKTLDQLSSARRRVKRLIGRG